VVDVLPSLTIHPEEIERMQEIVQTLSNGLIELRLSSVHEAVAAGAKNLQMGPAIYLKLEHATLGTKYLDLSGDCNLVPITELHYEPK
jgi:hypothetical protein